MKIIEAMKQIKDLHRKATDLRGKVSTYCVDMDFETPIYGTPAEQSTVVRGWIQAHSDIVKEMLRLHTNIQKTNLTVEVPINLNGKTVTKTIAEWVLRRRVYANVDFQMWKGIGDRGLKEGQIASTTPGGQPKDVKIRRYYDPKERDKNMELYSSEPALIDATLEVVNATTDLIE